MKYWISVTVSAIGAAVCNHGGAIGSLAVSAIGGAVVGFGCCLAWLSGRQSA